MIPAASAPDAQAFAGAGSAVEVVFDPHVLAAVVLLAVALAVLLLLVAVPIGDEKRGQK